MRESRASVESLVGACASTDRLHDDVPQFLFVCRGSSVDVGAEKDFGVSGFRVVHINLSGTEVLDLCVDELFRRVKDRVTGGEHVQRKHVLSNKYEK